MLTLIIAIEKMVIDTEENEVGKCKMSPKKQSRRRRDQEGSGE